MPSLRAVEDEKRAGEKAELPDDRAPLHPMRVYGELGEVLDRDAIVDRRRWRLRLLRRPRDRLLRAGLLARPGPFGCLGCGPGYALAAKLAYPERQVVILLGDGAFGFSAWSSTRSRATA